jgi:hypothetical protein
MAEVVGADLHLEPVGGAGERTGHDSGVVDQQVQRPVAPALAKWRMDFEAGEVQHAEADALGQRLLR